MGLAGAEFLRGLRPGPTLTREEVMTLLREELDRLDKETDVSLSSLIENSGRVDQLAVSFGDVPGSRDDEIVFLALFYAQLQIHRARLTHYLQVIRSNVTCSNPTSKVLPRCLDF